jgi:hypothetical protein
MMISSISSLLFVDAGKRQALFSGGSGAVKYVRLQQSLKLALVLVRARTV